MVRLALLLALTACGGGEPTYPVEWTDTYAAQAQAGRVLYVPYPWLLQGQLILPDTVLTVCQLSADSFNFGPCPTK